MAQSTEGATATGVATDQWPSRVEHGQRLPLLDLLRGLAILGTLMTNVWIFAAPGGEWSALSGDFGDTLGDLVAEPSARSAVGAVFDVLANGKFLSMLTILFGVGLAIQYRSAARRGSPWPGRYGWRALFLFAEGAVHFLLVFAWDVLMGYAVVSLLVAWLLTRSPRARKAVAGWLAGVHLLLMTLLTAALLAAPADEAEGSAGGPTERAEELFAGGDYLGQIAFRLENALVLRAEPVLSFGLLVVLFLLGVWLFRAGAFAPDEQGRRIRRRMLVWGLGVGVPLNLATSLGGMDFFLLSRYVAAPVVAVGYIGLVGVVSDRIRARGPLTAGLTAVGRTALSCYVLQNVLASLVCYGLGLGLAARWESSGPWWVVGLWAAVCVVLLVGASLWLRRFSHGPLEALQRRALRR